MQQFTGTYTALVTPFRNDQVDAKAFAKLIDEQIGAGVDGIVAVGTTGESPTLDSEEHLEVIRLAVEAAGKRCKVIGGTGSNNTRKSVDMTRSAEEAGADAVLLVSPYYNKPSQEGMYRHFRTIAEATCLPVILYSVPTRTVVDIGVETVRRLAADCPNVVAIKEAGGNVDRVSQLRAVLPPDFTILSGDDVLTLPFLVAGAAGVISVASNVIPHEIVRMVGAFSHGKLEVAQAIHHRYHPLFKDLFIEPNPVPVKVALSLARDWMTPDVRLPLCEMSPANLDQLRRTLAAVELCAL